VKICEKSSKVITFIDLAGHERYLKTTVFGMTGHAPDFGMLMVGLYPLRILLFLDL
jgi:GTPase